MEVLKIKTKSNGKDTKDKIIELFFTEHLRPVDISKKLNVGMSYITKIIQKDVNELTEEEHYILAITRDILMIHQDIALEDSVKLALLKRNQK